jgi:hypothetical protein
MRCPTAVAVCVCAAAPTRAFFATQAHISATRLGAGVVRRRSCAASALSMVTLPKGSLYQAVSSLSYILEHSLDSLSYDVQRRLSSRCDAALAVHCICKALRWCCRVCNSTHAFFLYNLISSFSGEN